MATRPKPKATAKAKTETPNTTDKNPTTALAAQAAGGLPSTGVAGDFEQYAGAGTENVGVNDVIIPRLTIVQGLSPQLQKKKPEYIEGSEIGDICDVATGDLFKEGVLFLPVYYRKDWLEWAPRASGKGLVTIHQTDEILEETTRDDKGRPFLENGNYIAETAQWFGLNLTAGRRKCFIPMASSQLKRSRKFMTMVTNERIARSDGSDFQAPIFYRAYNLSTAEESNADGDWSVWNPMRGPSLPELGERWQSYMAEAVAFREALIAGEARGDMSQDIDGEAAGKSDDGGAM